MVVPIASNVALRNSATYVASLTVVIVRHFLAVMNVKIGVVKIVTK